MSNIDDVLEKCLTDLLTDASTLEECLARHPEHVTQLEPLLRSAARVKMASQVRPSPVFKAHARNRLVSYMRANPRGKVSSITPFWRMMPGLIAIMLTLFATGTVYAQGALPGDPFYNWKLTSEHAWRLVSPDSLTTDLRIANRRITEMNVTVNDHDRWARALAGYSEVRSRLEFEMDSETLDAILPPVELIANPNAATVTPEPVIEPLVPSETVAPSSAAGKDKNNDQKDKEDKDKQDKDKDKQPRGVSTAAPKEPIPLPPTKAPGIIPTIEIPPPIQ